MGFSQGSFELAIPGLELGINLLWSTDPETGFSMPDMVRQRRAFDEVLRAKVLITPSEIGMPFDTEVLGDLAWSVLTKLPPQVVVGFASSWALRIEAAGAALGVGIVRALGFDGALGARLVNLAAAGEVFFNHDCLRWIVREAAAGSASGAWAAASTAPIPMTFEHATAARVLFPCLVAGIAPWPFEIARAAWVLHQVYRFTEDAHARYSSDHEAGLSAITAMVSLQPQSGAWASRFDRWREIFAVADSDPLIANMKTKPSGVRAAFNASVGVSIDEWLALLWFISMRYMALASRPGANLVLPVGRLLSESLATSLGPRFERALRQRAISSFADFGAGVLAENSATYRGIGTISTTESLSARNAPLIDIGSDFVAPLGLHALAERAVTLPRLVVGRVPGTGGVREANSTIGKCFEAYVRDVSLRAEPRHRVLSGAEIDSIVPAGLSRCDALISYQHEYLLVEAGLQTLPTVIAQGNVVGIRAKGESYHSKADQADATKLHLDAIARRFGLLPPAIVSTLVVTDVPVPLTPSLFEELQRQRPTRNPLFLVSIDEFERLVASGEIWSIPGVVANWQGTGRRVPMLVHLAELRKFAPVPHSGLTSDATAWLNRLGTPLAS